MSKQQFGIEEALKIIQGIPAIESILSVVSHTTGMGFAAVAIVTDTAWVAAAVNDKISFGLLPGGELQLESTICNEIRQHHKEVVIDHVAVDEYYANHHTPLQYGFQSYISFPIFLKDGSFFGTLCAIDPNPNRLNTPETVNLFRHYTDLISYHIESARQIKETEDLLKQEQIFAETKDLFMAILGHDLRNPLTATINSARLIQRMADNKAIVDLAKIVQNSSYRMKSLIDNIIEYSRNRVIGSGWNVEIEEQANLQERLQNTIEELRMNWPKNQNINFEHDLNEPVNCDINQVCQLTSNLLANALIHGDSEAPVTVNATSKNGEFTLSVTNQGKPIPPEKLSTVFKPFAQADPAGRSKGLGLGLYIVSEIAKAHKGQVGVVSDDSATIFTMTMPAN